MTVFECFAIVGLGGLVFDALWMIFRAMQEVILLFVGFFEDDSD